MIFQTKLENGLTIVLEPVLTSSLIAFELFIPNGALTEPILGASSVLEEWLRRGAGTRDARALEDAWDDLGAIRGTEVGLEGMEFSVTCLARDAAAALALLADLVLRPHFAQTEFAPSLELAISALQGLEDAPDELLYARLWKAAFASPHGRSPYGHAEGFSRLTPDLLRADYAQRCTPHGAILAVSGAIEWSALLEFVKQHFAMWQGEILPNPEVIWNAPFTQFEARETAQTQIGMMMPLMPFTGKGYYESRFALEVLGGGNSNRLFNEVREQRGLVYGIHAGSSFVKNAGTLEVFASCTPAKAAQTIAVIQAELEIWQQGINADELARAKVGIETGLAMSSESVGARAASGLRDMQLIGRLRSLEEVETGLAVVTLEGINAWLQTLDFSQLRTYSLGADVSA